MIQKPKINNPRLANNYYNSFKQRHPDITSSIFNATDCSSRNQLRMLHSNLTDHLTDSNLLEIFDDPKRIANCDIMQLPVDPMKKYYCEAIFTCCANGSFLRPLVFVSGNKSDMKFKQYDQFDELEKVSEETLEYYIKYSFVTSMNYYRVTFPVVLMLDLQRFEISSQIMSLCVKHKIILMSPYSHFKQIIQPFEVAVVFSIKLNWKKFLVNSFGKDFGESLTSINFAKTLKLFCDHHLSPDRIKYAFKICGIYPWSQFGIDHKDLMRFCRTRPVESNTRNCNLLIAAKDEETMQSVYRNDQLTRT